MKIAPGAGAMTQSSVSVSTGGVFDVTNNRVVITLPNQGSAVAALLSQGYNHGTWTGLGIDSSAAAVSPLRFAVGYLDGANAGDRMGGHVAANQTMLAFTLGGDAFLENSVGFDDLVVVAQNFGKTGEDWAGGNFTYDAKGSVGFADLVLVAQNFGASSGVNEGTQGESLSPAWNAGASAVPEPTAIALVCGSAAGLLARRRRSRGTASLDR
jgi:hypothetical protein